MAEISRFILEYTDIITAADVPVGEGLPPKAVIHRFLRLFKQVHDPRMPGMVEYPIEEIILMTFLAIMGSASTWEEIEGFAVSRERWLKKFIPLRNGIPSHDTFRRVFSLINTRQLQDMTVHLLTENLFAIKKALGMNDDEIRQICVDGKEQRGSGRKYNSDDKVKNLQTLHIYDASNSICLYSEAISEKTNEIPVAQDILKKMDLRNCIVTFDALHMQKKTVEAIADSKGDYVGGLKGNQSGLLEEAAAYFDEQDLLDHYRSKGQYYSTTEKSHGQIEKREYYLCYAMKRKATKDWKKLKCFICFIKEIIPIHGGESKKEIRYYASSTDDTKLCADAIRGHWGVENTLHWHLDFSFREDDNTTMDESAFNNYSLMNKMALTLLKLAKPVMKNRSIKTIRKMLGWNYEDALAQIFSCFDEDYLRQVLENV